MLSSEIIFILLNFIFLFVGVGLGLYINYARLYREYKEFQKTAKEKNPFKKKSEYGVKKIITKEDIERRNTMQGKSEEEIAKTLEKLKAEGKL